MAHIAIDARIIRSSTGRYVERLLHYLEQLDTSNHYSVLVPPKDVDYWQPTNPNFEVLAVDAANYSVAEQTTLKQFLDKLQPDLVHFCMPQQPAFYNGKHITTFHDLTLVKTYNSDKNWLVYHSKQLIGRWIFKRVAQTSEHIITPSEFTKKELISFARIPKSKVTVTYEAGEVTTQAMRQYELPFKQYMLYVGQQSDYKNIKRLAASHQKLRQQYPDFGLVLAGSLNASAQQNKAYFASKHYKGVVFTDFVSDEQLNWLYAHAAVYVFPSLMEGFGLPGLEAMAHGLPLVSSNATSLPEIYGKAARYFDPFSIDDMVQAIATVLSDKPLQKQLVAAGYQQIKKYSWKKMAEQTLAVYKKALHQN